MDIKMLEKLQHDTFQYFLREVNPANGLVKDTTRQGSPSSITATGLGLAAYTVGVVRGWISREEAVNRTLTTLRFLWIVNLSSRYRPADVRALRGASVTISR